MSARHHSSRPDHWAHPRPHRDPSLRRKHYGPVQPMEYDEPSLLSRARGALLRLLKTEGRL